MQLTADTTRHFYPYEESIISETLQVLDDNFNAYQRLIQVTHISRVIITAH